jgi:site-specific DNA recombinase
MKTAVYIRVSTEEQAQEGYSIASQKQKLTDFAKIQDWSIHDYYIDDGYSAKDLKRPAIQRLIQDCQKGLFDVVLVYKLDRLVRSVRDLDYLMQLFDRNKIKFKSATEVFDTTTAMGRFFITLVAAIAQWERETTAERVFMNMKHKVAEGERPGAAPPFGYDLINGKLVINEEEAKWVRFIFENYKKKGKTAIAAELNKRGIRTKKGNYWQGEVVTFVAKNPVYAGYIRWNYRKLKGNRTHEEIIVEGDHEPIISKELFDEVQEIMKQRSGKGYKGNTEYPFTGKLKCARCGKPLIGAKKKRKDGYYRFYRCSGRFQYKICDLPIVPEDVLEETFFNELEAPVQHVNPIESEIDVESLEKELEKVHKKMNRIKELYLEGDIEKEEYNFRMEKEKEKELEIVQALQSVGNTVDIEEVYAYLKDLKHLWTKMKDEKKKEALDNIIDYIKVDVTYAAKHRGERSKIEIVNYKIK